jgi:hypothetical protein
MKFVIFPDAMLNTVAECLLDFPTEGHGLAGRSSLANKGQSNSMTVTISQCLSERCQLGLRYLLGNMCLLSSNVALVFPSMWTWAWAFHMCPMRRAATRQGLPERL